MPGWPLHITWPYLIHSLPPMMTLQIYLLLSQGCPSQLRAPPFTHQTLELSMTLLPITSHIQNISKSYQLHLFNITKCNSFSPPQVLSLGLSHHRLSPEPLQQPPNWSLISPPLRPKIYSPYSSHQGSF